MGSGLTDSRLRAPFPGNCLRGHFLQEALFADSPCKLPEQCVRLHHGDYHRFIDGEPASPSGHTESN